MSENRDIEIEWKEETAKSAPKETRGRPKGVKDGEGKKKPAPKKTKKSTKTESRASRYLPKEREQYLRLVKKHFGASEVQEKLDAAGKRINQWEPVLRQLKAKMERQLEDEKREVEEYYAKIDEEYKKVGRPKSVFNERELRYLCSIHCTLDEIAGFFQMHKRVLQTKIREEYDMTWTQFYEQNSQGSKVSLRRRQIQAAMEGDTKMLVFLGKNMLGQKEKIDFDGEVKVNSWVDLVNNIGGEESKDAGKKDNGESENVEPIPNSE